MRQPVKAKFEHFSGAIDAVNNQVRQGSRKPQRDVSRPAPQVEQTSTLKIRKPATKQINEQRIGLGEIRFCVSARLFRLVH